MLPLEGSIVVNAEGLRVSVVNAEGLRVSVVNAEGVRKFQPRVGHNPGLVEENSLSTLKAFANVSLANAFSVGAVSLTFEPRVVASSNPGLKLANAFGVQTSAASRSASNK